MTLPLDLSGIALIITAVFGGVVTVISTVTSVYLQLKASRKSEINKAEAIAAREEQNIKLDTVATAVNGHATEQQRQIVALHSEVVRLQAAGTTTPQQSAGKGGALVGIDQGIVTVEHPAHDRREGDTPPVSHPNV